MGDFSELTERLLYEVALSGTHGLSAQQFETVVRDHYDKKNSNANSNKIANENEDAVDLLFSEAPPVLNTTVDDDLLLSTLQWLREHPDIDTKDVDDSLVQSPSSTFILESALRGKRIFASEDRIWHAIAGHGIDYKRMPLLEFEILSLVAAHGPRGIVQPQVVKLTGQDKRSVPQRTDRLAAKGYIVKENVIAAGSRTSNLKLKRYASDLNLPATDNPVSQPASTENQRDVIHYDIWFNKTMQFLRDSGGIVSVTDLRQHLGFSGRQQEKKILRGCLRRILGSGCIRCVMAKVCDAEGNQLFHVASGKEQKVQSVQLLREPTELDRLNWSKSDGKSRKRFDGFGDEGNGEVADEIDIEDPDEDDGHLDEEGNQDDLDLIEERMPPQWTPDTPLVNLIYKIVEEAGPDGISTTHLANRLTGQAWRRPLDQVMLLLTAFWQSSQPSHLRHLSIIRDSAVRGKMTHFRFRTYANFQKAVDSGTASWESVAVDKKGKARRQASDRKGDLDEWGFPSIPLKELSSHQMSDGSRPDSDRVLSTDVMDNSEALQEQGDPQVTPRATETGPFDDGVAHSTTLNRENNLHRGTRRLIEAELNDRPNDVQTHTAPGVLELGAAQLKALPAPPAQESAPQKRRPYKRRKSPKGRAAPLGTINEGSKHFGATVMSPAVVSQSIPNSVEDSPQNPHVQSRQGLLGRQKSGVYVNPPGAQEMKRRSLVGRGRGRPPKALIAVFKSKNLLDLDWFQDDQVERVPRVAPASRRQHHEELDEAGSDEPPAKKQRLEIPGNCIQGRGDDDSLRVEPAQTASVVSATPDPMNAGSTEATSSPALAAKSLLQADQHRRIFTPATSAPVAKSPPASTPDTLDVTRDTPFVLINGPAPSDNGLLDSSQPLPLQQAIGEPERHGNASGPPVEQFGREPSRLNAAEQLKALKSKRGRRSKETKRQMADLEQQVEQERITGTMSVKAPIVERPSDLRPRPDVRTQQTARESESHSEESPGTAGMTEKRVTTLAVTDDEARSPADPTTNAIRPLNDTFTTAPQPPNGAVETPQQLKKGNFTVSNGKLVEVFDKAYVQAHPLEVFHHRGHGRYARGPKPAKIAASVLAEQVVDGDTLTSAQDAQLKTATPMSRQTQAPEVAIAVPLHETNATSAPTEQLTALRSQGNLKAVPVNAATSYVHTTKVDVLSPLRIVKPYSDLDSARADLSNVVKSREPETAGTSLLDGEYNIDGPRLGHETVQSGSTSDSGTIIDVDEQPARPHIAHRSPARSVESAARSLPNVKKSSTVRTGGFMFAQRQQVILDALRACDGVFPGYHEMWCVCATAWKRIYNQTPDRHTIENAVNHLLDSQKLTKLHLEFSGKNGHTVQRYMLLEPSVDPECSKVKDLQREIIDAYPSYHLPLEVDIDDELRVKNNKLGKRASMSLEAENGTSSAVSAKTKSMFVNDPSVTVRQPREDSAIEAERARQQGFSDVLAYRQHLVREAKAKRVTAQAGYNDKARAPVQGGIIGLDNQTDTQSLTPKRSIPALPRQPLGSLRSSVRHPRKIRRPRDVDGDKTLEDEALPGLRAASLLQNPTQIFHKPTGTFGTSPLAIVPRVPEVRTLRNRTVILNDVEEPKLAQASSNLPDDLLGILSRAPRRSDSDLAAAFFQEIDHVKAWEDDFGVYSENVRYDDVFINHTLNQAHVYPNPEENWQASTIPALIPRPLATQSLLTPEVSRRTLAARKKYTSRKNSTAIVQNGAQTSDPDFVPGASSLKRRRVRAQDDTGELTGRDRKSGATFKDDKRLLVAIALMTTVCGGMNLTRLPWNLVAHAMSFRYDGQFYRRRWDHCKRSWSNEMDRLRSRIREAFLVAYERDELPKVDFQNPTNTDWPWLLEWVQQEVVPSVSNIETPDVPDLLLSKKSIEEHFDVQEKTPVFRLNSDEGFSNLTEIGRKHYAVRYTHGVPLSVVDGINADDAMILKTWVRAIVTAKQWNYDAEAAAAKLKATFSDRMIEEMSAEMVESRIVAQEKKGRQLPGRNFVLHNDVLSQFRRWPAKPEEHQYLRMVATSWTKINEYLQSHEQLELVAAASDPEYLVLTNMVAQGQVKAVAILPPIKPDYDAPFPKLSPWGYGGASYESKKIKTDVLTCPITYVKTFDYQSHHGLTSGVTIPLMPPTRPGEKGERIPFWVDIHGNLIDDIWDMVVRSVINLIVYRPGSTASKMQECHNNKFWDWEIELVLDWMERTGIAVRCGAGTEVNGIWTGGWRAGEWWYCAFVRDIATWRSPTGSEISNVTAA